VLAGRAVHLARPEIDGRRDLARAPARISTHGEMIDVIDDPVSQTLHVSGITHASDDRRSLEQVEHDYIVATLQRLEWRVTGTGGAAEVLDINSSTSRSRMRKLGIERPGRTITW
jgi:two-component system response regulator HydG